MLGGFFQRVGSIFPVMVNRNFFTDSFYESLPAISIASSFHRVVSGHRVLPDVRKGSLSRIDRVCIMKQIIAHGCAFINDAWRAVYTASNELLSISSCYNCISIIEGVPPVLYFENNEGDSYCCPDVALLHRVRKPRAFHSNPRVYSKNKRKFAWECRNHLRW